MKLRTQLVLAFLLLAVPLTGVTVYSYIASQRAFRKAVEAEAGALAEQMSSQTEEVVRELDPADLPKVQGLGLVPAALGVPSTTNRQDWVVVMRRDPASGISAGVARPVGAALQEIRRTAARGRVLP